MRKRGKVKRENRVFVFDVGTDAGKIERKNGIPYTDLYIYSFST